MINFTIQKKSKRSRARLGTLKTPHGIVETPAFVPVATRAVIKTLTTREVEATNSQLLIANTFHLAMRPGADVVKAHGGIHKFMDWKKPLMTDSGGFQVFSLGFGKDLDTGKILKTKGTDVIEKGRQPKLLRISEDGVMFQSSITGDKLFLGPVESLRIQEKLGADIMFAFDECTPGTATREYIEHSIARTHRWLKIGLKSRKTNQAFYGIVQGSKFKDLRKMCATFVSSAGVDGIGIGGDLGDSAKEMHKILSWTMPMIPEHLPRHLLGIGSLADIKNIVAQGIDTFDCTIPTHYARHGAAFTSEGKLNMELKHFLKDKKPLDPKCSCEVCTTYSRGDIAHLLRAKEMTGLRLLTFHNLFFFNNFVANIREQIKKGKL